MSVALGQKRTFLSPLSRHVCSERIWALDATPVSDWRYGDVSARVRENGFELALGVQRIPNFKRMGCWILSCRYTDDDSPTRIEAVTFVRAWIVQVFAVVIALLFGVFVVLVARYWRATVGENLKGLEGGIGGLGLFAAVSLIGLVVHVWLERRDDLLGCLLIDTIEGERGVNLNGSVSEAATLRLRTPGHGAPGAKSLIASAVFLPLWDHVERSSQSKF